MKPGANILIIREEQQVKIHRNTVAELRRVSSTVSENWDENAVPVVDTKLGETLPNKIKGIGKKTITTGAVTAPFGVLLLPLFLGGVSAPQDDKAKKTIASETSAFEQKLHGNL